MLESRQRFSVVRTGARYHTFEAAIEAARDGDSIAVEPCVYALAADAAWRISKSVRLHSAVEGERWSLIRAHAATTSLVVVDAARVAIEDFVIDGGGHARSDAAHAGPIWSGLQAGQTDLIQSLTLRNGKITRCREGVATRAYQPVQLICEHVEFHDNGTASLVRAAASHHIHIADYAAGGSLRLRGCWFHDDPQVMSAAVPLHAGHFVRAVSESVSIEDCRFGAAAFADYAHRALSFDAGGRVVIRNNLIDTTAGASDADALLHYRSDSTYWPSNQLAFERNTIYARGASAPSFADIDGAPDFVSVQSNIVASARVPDWSVRLAVGEVRTISRGGSPAAVRQPNTTVSDFSGDNGGWSWADQVGTHGAIVMWGGGHAGNISPQTFVFDVGALEFRRIGNVPAQADWKWENGSEIESGTREGASLVSDGFSYRYAPGVESKWPRDYRRRAVTYGELAPHIPAAAHTYGYPVVLPAGQLGGGAQGSLVIPVKASLHRSSGIYAYWGHQQDLASGRWRRLADELGPSEYYAKEQGFSGGECRWIHNQPNNGCADFDPLTNAIYLRCTFDASNRAIAKLDVSGDPGSERWVILPGHPSTPALGEGRIAGCVVSRTKYSVWIEARGDGTLMFADVDHDPRVPHTWRVARLSGGSIPSKAFAPSMVYVRSANRIVMYTNDGNWPADQIVIITPPEDSPTSDWRIERQQLTGEPMRPVPGPQKESWRKLLAAEKARVLLWYPDWSGGVQAIKPAFWAAGAV